MTIIYIYISVRNSAILVGDIWIPPLVEVYTLDGTYLNWIVSSWLIRYVRVGYDVFIYWKDRILKWSLFYGVMVWEYLPCPFLHRWLSEIVIEEWEKIELYKMWFRVCVCIFFGMSDHIVQWWLYRIFVSAAQVWFTVWLTVFFASGPFYIGCLEYAYIVETMQVLV